MDEPAMIEVRIRGDSTGMCWFCIVKYTSLPPVSPGLNVPYVPVKSLHRSAGLGGDGFGDEVRVAHQGRAIIPKVHVSDLVPVETTSIAASSPAKAERTAVQEAILPA